jgi:hypothetical protein
VRLSRFSLPSPSNFANTNITCDTALSHLSNMLTRSAVLGTGTSHGNGESSQTSTAKSRSTSYLPWSGPALHGGVLSHGYLEVGQVPPWPVKQSPVYHLAAIGRYGVDTPVSGPGHLQPGIGYEPFSRKPLGTNDNERPTSSLEIREILQKCNPKTQGMFCKHLPANEASTAVGHHGAVALDPDDTPNSKRHSTFSSSKTIAQHESVPPSNKAASRKRGHRYENKTAQEPEGSQDPQKKSKTTGMVSNLQYVEVFAQEPDDSTKSQGMAELPYLSYKRRFGDTDAGSTQQNLENIPVMPTRQISVATSRLLPKGWFSP